MRALHLDKVIPFISLLLYLVFFFATIQQVPFHPDEATQIYMSHDVDLLFSNPSSLIYHPENELSPEQRYRLIDSPLPRTIIGVGRNIFRLAPLPSDWNWSMSWEENQNKGALPADSLLLLSRISLAVFVPVGLVFFYLMLKNKVPWPYSLIATLFLGLNAVFLVHTRRAMAEGISFCSYFLIFYLLVKHSGKPWLIGIVAGFALLTKQTVSPILVLPLVYWTFELLFARRYASYLKALLVYFSVILLVYYMFNPIAWKDPLNVIALQIQTRVEFSRAQAADYLALSSHLAANTFRAGLISWLANTFFAQPAFFDVGNYAPSLVHQIKTYQSNFLNGLFSGWVNGVILLFLSLFGVFGSLRRLHIPVEKVDRTTLLLMTLSLLQTVFVLFFFPITFQRYYLLNLSLAVIWAVLGLHLIMQKIYHFK